MEVVGLARRFGHRWALRGVSLHVAAGEIVALTGHNGSGKTTLLRVLATALRPSRGTARVFDHDVLEDADAVRAAVGSLSHAPGLYADLTAAENLRFAQRMSGCGEDRATIAALLSRVGLGAEAGERVRGFSAGMQRRLALARLLLNPPRLLLLDEPFASFDAEGVALVNEVLAERVAAGGSALVATHDPGKATRIDRSVRLHAGRVAPDEATASFPPGAVSGTGVS